MIRCIFLFQCIIGKLILNMLLEYRHVSYATLACMTINIYCSKVDARLLATHTRMEQISIVGNSFLNAGTFVPKNFCSRERKFHRVELSLPGTKGCLDYSYPGLFVLRVDYSYLGRFVRWTIRTLDYSYDGLFVPRTTRTMDCSYHL